MDVNEAIHAQLKKSGVTLAASLPDAPFAHGVGTALLLASDVVSDPLIPVDGWLTPRRPSVDLHLLVTA